MSGDPFWQAITTANLDVDVDEGVLAFHAGMGTRQYEGECDITLGHNPMLRLVLRIAGFPGEGQGVPVRLTLTTSPKQAEWQRDFNGHVTRSTMRWSAKLQRVTERFGPFAVDMSFGAENRNLLVHIARLRCLGLPLPGVLCPRSETREFIDADGRFCFDVSAYLPVFGLLIRYRGRVLPTQHLSIIKQDKPGARC